MITSSRPPAGTATALLDEPPRADHEVQIATIIASEEKQPWQVTGALAAVMPFAGWVVRIERASPKAAPTIVVEAVLPCPALTQAESARFRTGTTLPRYALRITEAVWCHACAVAELFKVPLTPLPLLALLVLERLVSVDLPPVGRPFIEAWHRAIVDLAAVTANMSWQGVAVQFDRHGVHKLRMALKDDARTMSTEWRRQPEGSR